jgi:hypothetical protein
MRDKTYLIVTGTLFGLITLGQLALFTQQVDETRHFGS